MFRAAFERSRRCGDVSFSGRRNFFGDHSPSFGFCLCAALGYPQTPEQNYSLGFPAHACRLSR
jgi:hypothetical protein